MEGSAPPDFQSPAETDTAGCAEDKKRVHLHAPAQTMYSTSSAGEESVIRVPGSRLFAITLRLRVTQIVAGIVMILLGAVACLEDSVRATLGLGIPTGVLTVIASIANIQASRRFFAFNFMNMQAQGNPHLVWNTQTPSGGPLGNLKPFLPTLACILACLPLLALSCIAAISTDKNRLVLGCLLGISSALVIMTEAAVWLLRYQWAKTTASS